MELEWPMTNSLPWISGVCVHAMYLSMCLGGLKKCYRTFVFFLRSLSLSNLGTSAPAGPPSASLLQEWLDINQLDPEDMDVLQKELEAGAPDSIIGALDDL